MIELIEKKMYLDNDYEIREYYTDNGMVRALVSNECTQSLIYIDKQKTSDLGLDYFKYYDLPMTLNPSGTTYLMLGGGAFSYPHHYLNKYKDKKIDVIEINKKCIEYAEKYFYLRELIQNNGDRLNITVEDAINYIANTENNYDYILIDLFNGKEPVKEIYEEKNMVNLKRILKKNGIIIINYIILSDSYKNELNRMITLANNYKIIANNNNFDSINNKGNIIIILSDNNINIPDGWQYFEINNLVNLNS